MKKVSIALMTLLFSMFLFSCTEDAISDTDARYETLATEGDDGDVNEGRDNDDEEDNN